MQTRSEERKEIKDKSDESDERDGWREYSTDILWYFWKQRVWKKAVATDREVSVGQKKVVSSRNSGTDWQKSTVRVAQN